MGPTCFDDIIKLSRLPLKSLSQDTQAWQKFANNLFRRRNVNRRLEDVVNELVVKSSLHYLLGRGDDSLALLRVQQSQLHVGPRSGELDQSHSPNEFLRKAQTRYWKVLNGPLGLSAIIRRTRDFDFAHGVPVQPILLNRDHYRDAEESPENWD